MTKISINEKRMKYLYKYAKTNEGTDNVAVLLLSMLPYRKLKEVCEALEITDEQVKKYYN